VFNKNQDERFIEVFKASIQETMQSLIGESPSKALLFHLKFPESAERPTEFSANLRTVLRDGSPVVENAILKRLWDKMGLFLVHASESGSFVERVGRARELYAERQKQRQVFAR